jgi:hypothetical protein
MKITIESTGRIVDILPRAGAEPVPARLWEGTTDSGIEVKCLVTRIAARKGQDLSQFDRELQSQREPSPNSICYPLRLIL